MPTLKIDFFLTFFNHTTQFKFEPVGGYDSELKDAVFLITHKITKELNLCLTKADKVN